MGRLAVPRRFHHDGRDREAAEGTRCLAMRGGVQMLRFDAIGTFEMQRRAVGDPDLYISRQENPTCSSQNK